MTKLFAIASLLLFFLKEVVWSNLSVARDVLRPNPAIDPRILTLQLGPLTERQAFFLANMVTMTPGTLSLDLSDDRRTLTVHTLYGSKAKELNHAITHSYHSLIRKAL